MLEFKNKKIKYIDELFEDFIVELFEYLVEYIILIYLFI